MFSHICPNVGGVLSTLSPSEVIADCCPVWSVAEERKGKHIILGGRDSLFSPFQICLNSELPVTHNFIIIDKGKCTCILACYYCCHYTQYSVLNVGNGRNLRVPPPPPPLSNISGPSYSI